MQRTSTLKSHQQMHILGGTLGLLFGMIFSAAGVYAITHPQEPQPITAEMPPIADVASCQMALSKLGFSAVSDKDGVLTVSPVSGFAWQERPREQLTSTSLGIRACAPGFKLQTFCMGSSCSNKGLTFQLVTAYSTKPKMPSSFTNATSKGKTEVAKGAGSKPDAGGNKKTIGN